MPLKEVSKLITGRLGIQIREQDIDRLGTTLANRCELLKLPDLGHYSKFLNCPAAESEWDELAALLTTGETFFYRDQAQADLLRKEILPGIIERRRNERWLRIWSAGCSTGEEPYSLAIMLRELLPDLRDWKIHILATDINNKALDQARHGRYSDWSFRRMDAQILLRHFRQQGEQWEVDGTIKKLVTFQTKNLLTGRYPDAASGDMDLIVCRNVFIYFGPDDVARIVDHFKNSLRPDGYLLTGHAELQRLASIPLKTCMYPQSVVYQRKDASVSNKSEPESIKPDRMMPAEVKFPAGQFVSSDPKVSDQIQHVEQLLAQESRSFAAKSIDQPEADSPRDEHGIMVLARTKADQAKYDEAIKLCQRAIELNSFAAAPRYLLAQIADEQGRDDDARNLFKKAIYLDPDHLGAYFDLVTMHARAGELEQANKVRTRLFEILKQTDEDQAIEGHGHLTAGQLREEIMNELTP